MSPEDEESMEEPPAPGEMSQGEWDDLMDRLNNGELTDDA